MPRDNRVTREDLLASQRGMERQRDALLEVRRIMTDMEDCMDYLDVLHRIEMAVRRGLGEGDS